MKTLTRAAVLALAATVVLPVGVALTAPAGADTLQLATTHSTTVTLNASADTFINKAHPWRHYGSWSSLRVGGHHWDKKRAYVRFAVPSSDAARVTHAELVVSRTAHHFPTALVSASATSSSWWEHHLSAMNAPTLGRVLASRWVNSSRSYVSFDVTSAVRGHSKVGIALTSRVQRSIAMFKARDWYAGPKLVLTVDSPSTSTTPPTTTEPDPPTTTEPTPPSSAPPSSTPPSSTPPSSTPPSTTPPSTTPPSTTPPSTTPPSTTPPSTTPPSTTPPSTTPPSSGCSVSAKLVSSCQVWFGDTPQAYTHSLFTPASRLSLEEAFTGRKFDILHEYSVNAKLFPSSASIALADQGRMLAETWKPAMDMTWAAVAAGKADDRIDAEAAYLKTNFDRPFFLSIYHEPEDNVINTPGSGMTPADYVAMYRHTIQRLHADGATMFVTVMNYMGYTRWDSMRNALYPGDDVVDWIAYDPYMYNPGNTASNDFAALVDGPNTGHFYTWATTTHPGKPIMIAEWGAYDNTLNTNPLGMAQFYSTITSEISRFPALKALDHFTMNPIDVAKGSGTSPTETAAGLLAWQNMAAAPIFN